MAIIGVDDLPEIRAANRDKTITFCSGSFDLFHVGHVVFLERTKREFGGFLVVSVGNDLAIRNIKGDGRPVMDQVARLRLVNSQRAVDFCYLDTISRSKDELALVLESAFERLRPNYYVFNDDAFDMEARRKLCNKYLVEMRVRGKASYGQFLHESTTAIIERAWKIQLCSPLKMDRLKEL